MRWKAPQVGDTRTRSGFLFLPKTINGETRWLERAEWTERFSGVHVYCYGEFVRTECKWLLVEWIDEH